MNASIELVQGDITKMKVDAIVNAANSSLLGGGGVDGAIHRAGGPQILEECHMIRARQGGCPTGEAVITSGGRLLARYVIHTVGPVYRDGRNREAELLAACYGNSLQLAVDNGIATIAFPNISTGVYGYPKADACRIALESVFAFLAGHDAIRQITFVCFDEENFELYQKALKNQGL